MAQINFGSNASPSLPNLDANFTDLYRLRERITDEGYTAATPSFTATWTGGSKWSVAAPGSTAAALAGFRAYNAGNTDSMIIGQSSSAYTTGGALAWVGNSQAFLYYPSSASFKIGTATGTLPVLECDPNGNVITKVNTSAPSLTINNQMVFALTSNTNLRISVRGSDGTTRVANITLA